VSSLLQTVQGDGLQVSEGDGDDIRCVDKDPVAGLDFWARLNFSVKTHLEFLCSQRKEATGIRDGRRTKRKKKKKKGGRRKEKRRREGKKPKNRSSVSSLSSR
jgi:hypothetical protein